MELSKEQIEQIEKRLKKKGVNYWDIRIELLDHIVTDIENRLRKNEKLENAIERSFYALGFNGNLKELTKSRLLGINHIVRKQYFRKIQEFLTTPFYLLCTLIFLCTYFFVYSFSSTIIFKTVTLTLLLIPIIMGAINYTLELLHSRRSGYLLYSSFYIFFSFLILNMFIQFIQPKGIIPVSEETQKLVWFGATLLNSIFSMAGILTYLDTSKKIKTIRKKLLSL